MSTRASTYVAFGQISLLLFIAICVVLQPGYVFRWSEVGLSNYGIHIKTAIPYTLAFGLSVLGALKGATILDWGRDEARAVRRVLFAYSAIIVLMVLSTYVYSFNTPLKDVHDGVGIVTMTFESAASWWMYRCLDSKSWNKLLLVTALVGFVCAAVDFVGVVHILLVAQLLTGASFGTFLVRAVEHIDAGSQ